MAPTLLGVDTGGTFTDFVLLSDGSLRIHKVLSTPDDPARAILQGLTELGLEAGPQVLVHGSTVATNAVLEKKGTRTGLVTTAGFRDVLEIGRQDRPHLYRLSMTRDPPLVPRRRRLEVSERLDERGQVVIPLDEASLAAVVERLQAAGVESAAVCLLFSFANAAHEQRVAGALRSAGLSVSASHEVLPEFREYERTSTTVLNAYVGPLVDRYLGRLEEGLPVGTRLRVMQSNGGSISAATARREAARTLLSGPAGGVIGAAYVARASGFARAISFDMGGTSTDVCLIDGQPAVTSEGRIGGYPCRLPMIDIHTIGAGGGSIARFDAGGALRVGPWSAGADPGPAAYARGGTEPTVTDGHVVLGRLLPERFLGGTMRLDAGRAEDALTGVARRLGSGLEEAALGVLRVVNANMEGAIRVISVERGYDPRQFTLVAFGGAGPLHACELASRLGIPRVLVPAVPGVLSALGMLVADTLKDYVRTIMLPAIGAAEAARQTAAELSARGLSELVQEGLPPERMVVERWLDLRYRGQSYELTAPYEDSLERALEDFHRLHEQRFGYASPDEPVEVVNVRVRAHGLAEAPPLDVGQVAEEAQPKPGETREVAYVIEDRLARCEMPVYARASLLPGMVFDGPALVLQYDSTALLPPGWRARIDGLGSLIAERAGA